MITTIGSGFPSDSQWSSDESHAFSILCDQIEKKFGHENNIVINTTWFGPQFGGEKYGKVLRLIQENKKFDNIFFVSMVDEIMLVEEQVISLSDQLGTKKIFLVGNFDTEYSFSFIGSVLPKYFKQYSIDELVMRDPKYLFVCYNRKPREHRVELVKKLKTSGLDRLGIVTLGKNDPIYSKTTVDHDPMLLDETPDEYHPGNWGHPMTFGIPHDIHSLGNIGIWQNHFLHVVSETIFNPWDHMFVTEKTFKPIIGMRPFVINGQNKIYSWLRQHGFKTFVDHFDVELESSNELEVHDRIIEIVKRLSKYDVEQIKSLYQSMLPDLKHNRDRFFEFAKEQKHTIEHLFDDK